LDVLSLSTTLLRKLPFPFSGFVQTGSAEPFSLFPFTITALPAAPPKLFFSLGSCLRFRFFLSTRSPSSSRFFLVSLLRFSPNTSSPIYSEFLSAKSFAHPSMSPPWFSLSLVTLAPTSSGPTVWYGVKFAPYVQFLFPKSFFGSQWGRHTPRDKIDPLLRLLLPTPFFQLPETFSSPAPLQFTVRRSPLFAPPPPTHLFRFPPHNSALSPNGAVCSATTTPPDSRDRPHLSHLRHRHAYFSFHSFRSISPHSRLFSSSACIPIFPCTHSIALIDDKPVCLFSNHDPFSQPYHIFFSFSHSDDNSAFSSARPRDLVPFSSTPVSNIVLFLLGMVCRPCA